MINGLKNIAIIVDFVVSCIAFAIQKNDANFSAKLYMLSAVILAIAFVCALIDLCKKKKK